MSGKRRSYSTQQLADQLGVSVQSVKRWIDAGHVKAWKTMGGHRKIDAASADAFIRSMTAQSEAAALEVPSPPGSQPTVLVVEDDLILAAMLEYLVEEALPGSRVGRARNGFVALQELARATPDILITDVLMPYVDGVEMLKYLAEQNKLPALVIVISMLPREEMERRGGLPAGTVYVPKPLDPKAVVAHLRSFSPRPHAGG